MFTLNQFTITPDKCKVRYECATVERVDAAPSSIACSDLTFDGEINYEPTDGVLTFSADSDDYENDTHLPGEYRVTIKGTAYQALDQRFVLASFVLTLNDPCYPPELLEAFDHEN